MKFSFVGATTLACLHQGLCIEDGVVLLQSQVHTSEVVQSLFPDMANLKDPRKSRAVLAQIQQSVSSLALDRSQITPEVQTLVATVIATLQGTALPPVQTDHGVDQQNLNQASDFSTLHAEYTTKFTDLNVTDGDTTINTKLADLQTCFGLEDGQCTQVDTCIDRYQNATYAWTNANTNLMLKDYEINRYWCVEDYRIRTELVFREESEVLFNNYNRALGLLENAESDQAENNTLCQSLQGKHIQQIALCNQQETEVITASCSHFQAVIDEVERYTATYSAKVDALQDMRASVRLREADRKIEWDVLERVICLLTTLTLAVAGDSDGALAGSQASIDACSSMWVSTDNLNIIYPYHPDMISLPAEPDHPCSTKFTMEIDYDHTCELDTDTNVNTEVNDFYDSLVDVAVCNNLCSADVPTAPESPNLDTTFLLLVDPSTTADFVITSNAGVPQWTATFENGTTSTGTSSPTYTSSSGASFGFNHGDTGRNQDYVNANQLSETTEASLLRVGGFFYLSDDGTTVLPKLIAPSTVRLDSASNQVLTFGDKVDMTAEPPCAGGFQPVLDDSWAPDGASEYCFQIASTSQCCSSGCFIFKYNAAFVGFTCYPVSGF